jgi:purine-nucleoside phosphorylase
MAPSATLNTLTRAANFLRRNVRTVPDIGIILGSGLGAVADSVESPVEIPSARIPGWPTATVPGHAGSLVCGMLEGKRVAVVRGRVHYYEGYAIDQVVFPVRVLRLWGAQTLIVTNAAGGLNPEYRPGDLMVITDHINLPGIGGANPLRGPNDQRLGPRFPDLSRAYDPELRDAAVQAAAAAGLTLRQGVYVCVAGPSFETPAESRYLRMIGADAVGMSTAPETVAARHAGMRVLGISTITNLASLDGSHSPDHAEVLQAANKAAPEMVLLLKTLLRTMP